MISKGWGTDNIEALHPLYTPVSGWIDTNPTSISRTELTSWQKEGLIEYLGSLNDVRHALADCLVYVLPSYREGTPRTVLEAMSMGRAVITTDAPGCRETVEDGVNGFLVLPRDSKNLAGTIMKFLEMRGCLILPSKNGEI